MQKYISEWVLFSAVVFAGALGFKYIDYLEQRNIREIESLERKDVREIKACVKMKCLALPAGLRR